MNERVTRAFAGFGALLFCLCTLALLFAAEKPKISEAPKFVPGEEVRIDVNDKDIGGDYFLVYVPSDYTDEHDWPAIFFFNGAGHRPSTELFRSITEGKGFIIIGMEYVKTGKGRMTEGQYINSLKRELKSIYKIQKRASEYFRIDKKRLFLTGFSRGGWRTAALIEHSAKPWAGAAIIAAGRNQASLPPPVDGKDLLRGKPIYIGAGEEDENMRAAKQAREFYHRRGADVTFEEYKGVGHMFKADSKILHDWLISNSAVERTESARADEQQKAD